MSVENTTFVILFYKNLDWVSDYEIGILRTLREKNENQTNLKLSTNKQTTTKTPHLSSRDCSDVRFYLLMCRLRTSRLLDPLSVKNRLACKLLKAELILHKTQREVM